MNKLIKIVDRIKNKCGVKSDGEVAELLLMSKSALANHKSRESIPFEALIAFCENNGISMDWLFTGEEQSKIYDSIDNNEFVSVFSVKETSAVYSSATNKTLPEDNIVFSKDWLATELSVVPKDIRIFKVSDDAMEPTLKYGDLVLINTTQSNNNGYLQFSDGLYLIDVENHLMIKRLQFLPNKIVQVFSDNLNYKPYSIEFDKPSERTQIIGRVMWAGKKMV